MKKLCLLLMVLSGFAVAQENFPINDVRDQRANAYAFTNATIYTDYQTKLEGATLLIRDREIVAVGKDIDIPAEYQVVDLEGMFLYPSLIDAYETYGVEQAQRDRSRGFRNRSEQINSNTKGAYNANQAIRSEFNASESFTTDAKAAKALRDAGFGAVQALRTDGIARGTATVVTLGDHSENTSMIKIRAANHWSFSKGVSTQDYPSSLMGSVALIRQTHLDAQWYAAHETKPFIDHSLEAILDNAELPQIFESSNWITLLRADATGDEFGVQYIIKSSGDSYKRIDAVKATGASLIVPLDYPAAMNVDDPYDAERVSLADLKHWELAPTNPGALEKAGINFALTANGNRKKADFHANLRKAIEHGLSEEAALKAMTMAPAQMLGVDNRVGSLAPGKLANFLIMSGPMFKKDSKIHENWIQGKRFVIKEAEQADYSGAYSLSAGDMSATLHITGKPGSFKASIPGSGEGEEKTDDISVKAKFDDDMVSMSFSTEKGQPAIRLTGWLEGKDWVGQGELPDGTWIDWKATYEGEVPAKEKGGDKAKKGGKGDGDKAKGRKGRRGGKDKADKADAVADLGAVTFPFLPYGSTEKVEAETILIKGATLWTLEGDGIMEDADILIKDGKISKVGKGLRAPRGARTIDGKGKHVTPGIIDEHSHLGLLGVNDVAVNSGMVRMNDVVNSEDVNIYRNLAGGVTAAQLLHGSANPVGGQSALIKMRWGSLPSEMLIEDAEGFIKFALGENVKRSRSSSSIRYPQSRMGVEQIYVDAFSAAQDYKKAWAAWNALSDEDKKTTPAPRRDLVQDAMVEILDGKRHITCHSYVQSEINMLMKVAEQFDFRLNTFTHILEGYKVADKMAEHGVGGSTFADWWAYKWEVRYAIPYNPTLMHNEGVVVAINSDDREMARRLNQEAAKSLKYGGMDEVSALKMVTLNPAKLLRLDDRMGSLKEGKDGDVVVWSDHPLSIYARVEHTMVDGRMLFDRTRDAELREAMTAERARLVAKMRDKGKNGARPAFGRFRPGWHCDDIVDMEGNLIHGQFEDMEVHH